MYIKEFIIWKEEDGMLTAENEDGIIDGIFLHSICEKITPSKYKRFKEIFKQTIYAMQQRKLNVYATPVDEKDEKWIKSFGFVETGLLLDGFKLLKYVDKLHKSKRGT